MSIKVNADAVRKRMMEQEEKKSGGGNKNNDTRFLNYYDLDFNQTITVRLLPASEDGDMFLKYSSHGSGLKGIRGVKNARCSYESTGESCPVCARSYDAYQAGDKAESTKWRGKDTFVAQCIVVDQDIDVPDNEDGNLVKMLYLPFNMKEVIKEAIINGLVDDPTQRDFVIKKTKNQGGHPDYGKSFFRNTDSPLPEGFEEALDSGNVWLYDLNKVVIPAPTTTQDMKEWMEHADEVINGTSGSRNTSTGGSSEGSSEEGEGAQKASSSDIRERLKNRLQRD